MHTLSFAAITRSLKDSFLHAPYQAWILANSIGAMAALALTPRLLTSLAPVLPQLYDFVLFICCTAVLWVLPQWIVLRGYLPAAFLWGIPALVSFALIGQEVQLTLSHGLWWIASLTIGQWAYLIWSGIPAHWWLLVNPAALIGSGLVIGATVFPLTFLLDVVDYGVGDRAIVVSLGIGGALYGLCTGFLLFRVWRIQQRLLPENTM